MALRSRFPVPKPIRTRVRPESVREPAYRTNTCSPAPAPPSPPSARSARSASSARSSCSRTTTTSTGRSTGRSTGTSASTPGTAARAAGGGAATSRPPGPADPRMPHPHRPDHPRAPRPQSTAHRERADPSRPEGGRGPNLSRGGSRRRTHRRPHPPTPPAANRLTNATGRRSAARLREKTGGVLLSQALASQVPSALRGLTALFGMGRGVSPSPRPPEKDERPRLRSFKTAQRHTEYQNIRQALDPLVPVSFRRCRPSRSGLSTWWSTRGLTPSRGWES